MYYKGVFCLWQRYIQADLHSKCYIQQLFFFKSVNIFQSHQDRKYMQFLVYPIQSDAFIPKRILALLWCFKSKHCSGQLVLIGSTEPEKRFLCTCVHMHKRPFYHPEWSNVASLIWHFNPRCCFNFVLLLQGAALIDLHQTEFSPCR